MDINALIRKHETRREEDHDEIKAALYACGWRSKSNYPGSLWLWSKSFPESKTQWIWKGRGADVTKVPNPPFTVNGVSLEIAVRMEADWQAHWDDNRPEPAADAEHEEAGENESVTGAPAEARRHEIADALAGILPVLNGDGSASYHLIVGPSAREAILSALRRAE